MRAAQCALYAELASAGVETRPRSAKHLIQMIQNTAVVKELVPWKPRKQMSAVGHLEMPAQVDDADVVAITQRECPTACGTAAINFSKVGLQDEALHGPPGLHRLFLPWDLIECVADEVCC